MSTESVRHGGRIPGRRSTFIAPESAPRARSRVYVNVERADEKTEGVRAVRGIVNAAVIGVVFWALAGLAGFGLYILTGGL